MCHKLELLTLDPAVAGTATGLPEPFHGDPADRVLVQESHALAVPLLSADSKIRSFHHRRLHHRHGARQHAGVVATLGRQGGGVAQQAAGSAGRKAGPPLDVPPAPGGITAKAMHGPQQLPGPTPRTGMGQGRAPWVT